MKPLPIYVGWDERETVAYHVFVHSILKRASIPVAIIPVVQSSLRQQGLYWRERGTTEATQFSMTRFLVPYLAEYRGIALFADCDMVMLGDVAELLEIAETQRLSHGDGPAVLVAKHDYIPGSLMKMDGQIQTKYLKKNWSSFMLMDCSKCTALKPHYVNTATGLDLHRFYWLGSAPDKHIGDLPIGWNWLVGEYSSPKGTDLAHGWSYPFGDLQCFSDVPPKNLHYTLGGPWMQGFEECDAADIWLAERDSLLGTTSVGV